MTPKRGAYPPEIRMTALSMLREGLDAREVADELGITLTTLRVWALQAQGGSHRPDRSRDSVIDLTTEAYERLDRLLRSVPNSALETPMPFPDGAIDPWRVKDAVAHVAHYKGRVARRLTKSEPSALVPAAVVERRIREYWDRESWVELELSDNTLKTLDPKTRRRHRMNHLVYLRWCDRSGREVLAWHRFVHKHLLSILESGPDEWFLPGEHRASRGGLSHEAVATISLHSDQHLRDIRKALGK